MAEEVKLELTVLSKENFGKVVDTSFKTFTAPAVVQDTDTVEELFRLFDKLFYSIPIYGPAGTLEELVTKSKELYVEPDQTLPEIQPLLDEIADLRARLLEANQQILTLSGAQ
jgi:hypothetical protein